MNLIFLLLMIPWMALLILPFISISPIELCCCSYTGKLPAVFSFLPFTLFATLHLKNKLASFSFAISLHMLKTSVQAPLSTLKYCFAILNYSQFLSALFLRFLNFCFEEVDGNEQLFFSHSDLTEKDPFGYL